MENSKEVTIKCVVPKDPYAFVDRKLNTLENMSAECGALLAKVAIKQSRITISHQRHMSFDALTLVRN